MWEVKGDIIHSISQVSAVIIIGEKKLRKNLDSWYDCFVSH